MSRRRPNKFMQWRKAAGLLQRDVAQAIGCSTTTVQQWEAGSNAPTNDKHEALAELFGVSVAEIGAARPMHKRRTAPQNRDICDMCPVLAPCRWLESEHLPTLCEEPDEAEKCFMEDVGILEDFQRLRRKRKVEG
jgi:transcriptional regulator with XRE-family HTH domain